ncbi:hypothetical protein JB92DRAFT_3101245 [Gautieria morchelliformis]|nr:hypothetical protein JB92DRAFT_3101245 [Gautieria morchelliformis]
MALYQASYRQCACFEWGREPPLIDRNTGDTESELRDWDAPFDDDMEVININSLPDFEEMDFGDVLIITNRLTQDPRTATGSSVTTNHTVDTSRSNAILDIFTASTEHEQLWAHILELHVLFTFRPKESIKESQCKMGQNKKFIQTDSEADRNETAQMMVLEYIKIYHDAPYAMKLRSLLDSFRWEDDIVWEKGRIISDALPLQYRVLKATRPVLDDTTCTSVDETGEAIYWHKR